jgi:hypothetical protein
MTRGKHGVYEVFWEYEGAAGLKDKSKQRGPC